MIITTKHAKLCLLINNITIRLTLSSLFLWKTQWETSSDTRVPLRSKWKENRIHALVQRMYTNVESEQRSCQNSPFHTKIKRDSTFFCGILIYYWGKVADIDTPPELSSIFSEPRTCKEKLWGLQVWMFNCSLEPVLISNGESTYHHLREKFFPVKHLPLLG